MRAAIGRASHATLATKIGPTAAISLDGNLLRCRWPIMCRIGEVLWNNVGLIWGDVRVYETCLIATGYGMEKVYDIPAILFGEFVSPCRHACLGNPVGQPVEKIACGMHGGVRLREEIHRFLCEGFGQYAVAFGLGSVAGHAVCGE
jgi:hypothetical protein